MAKRTSKRTTLYLRIDEDLKDALQKRAALEGRTDASLVRYAIMKYLQEADKTDVPSASGEGVSPAMGSGKRFA